MTLREKLTAASIDPDALAAILDAEGLRLSSTKPTEGQKALASGFIYINYNRLAGIEVDSGDEGGDEIGWEEIDLPASLVLDMFEILSEDFADPLKV